MSNKHQRLKQLEKLAAEKRVKDRATAESAEWERITKEVSAMSSEELKARYDAIMDEIKNKPPNPELANLTNQELINLYMEKCKES